MNIESTIFDTPSGNVRGVITLTLTLKGKKQRLAHATLLTDLPPDIRLDVPKRIAIDDLPIVAESLAAFEKTVQEIETCERTK